MGRVLLEAADFEAELVSVVRERPLDVPHEQDGCFSLELSADGAILPGWPSCSSR
jgi:hypothetical protein